MVPADALLLRSTARAPVQAPVRSSVQAAARSSVQAPTRAPVQAPVRSSVQAAVRAPVQAPPRAPVQAPARAPVQTPTTAQSPGAGAPGGDPASSWLDARDVEREARVSALFDAHHTELVRLAVLLGAAGDAEDIVAEAFCELYRRWGRLRDPAAAPAYLRSVVCNLVRMRLRHLQVVRRHVETPPGDVGSAEQEVVVREEHREVVAALRMLPDRQRQALVLRYWLDLKESEVAAAMGISAGAVKAHTSRGMAALTRMLGARR